MHYRQAAPQDLQDVTNLLLLLWPEDGREELEKENQELLASSNDAIYLAIGDERSIGVAHCSLRHDYVEGTAGGAVGFLEAVYVLPEYRNRGVSRALVELCEGWSRARGSAEFASGCELENTGSLHFHLKLGFEEVNRVICFAKKL